MQPITDVFRVFRYQRAIRSFTDEVVPDALVHQVLTAAIHGPSGSNTQPWHFIVVRHPTVKQAISEVYEEARAAGPTAVGRGRASASGGARPDRRLCQHSCLRPRRLPDGRLHLPQRAESPASGPSPGARELPHDAAPPPESPHPRDPRHPRPYRERGDHPARLARPGLWPEPAAPAGPVCEVRPLDRLNGRAPQEYIGLTRVPLGERHHRLVGATTGPHVSPLFGSYS